MIAGNDKQPRLRGIIAVSIGAVIIAGASAWFFMGGSNDATAQRLTTQTITTSAKAPLQTRGPSGLPLPRFVSLKRDRVNVRKGPSNEHKVAWVFQRKGLPVEIVAEFEHWRRVRDSDGEEGWVYHSLLAGRRTAAVAPWRKGKAVKLLAKPRVDSNIVANINAGVIGNINSCDGKWCKINIRGYRGFVNQSMLWGVYPQETIGN